MDEKVKSQLISEAYDKYAEIIESLKFIEENDNMFGPKGSDGLSIFYPHNITKVVDSVFHRCAPNYKDDSYRETIQTYKEYLMSDVLFGFKYRGDEYVGYILKDFYQEEPLILKSGRPSKNKTEMKQCLLLAGYNFYTGNIDVILMEGSTIDCLVPLVAARTPEEFYNDYLKYSKELENTRRNQPMTITVGMWEDIQEQIKKLHARIDEREEYVRNNYERRYNSEEE